MPPRKQLNLKQISLSAILTFSVGIAQAEGASQVIDTLSNKAISSIESGVNEFANDVANSFGNGNTEISISNIESGNPAYSIKTIQPLTTPSKDNKELVFVQGGVTSGENEGNRRNTINLGLGKRILVEDDKAIIGANVFVDYETSSKHKRASLGGEYRRSNFTLNANKYWALSDKMTINGSTEEALSGHDVKLTGQAPYAPWATIKGTHYYWDQTTGDNITGNILGVVIELSPSTSFELGSENSNTMSRTAYGKLTIKLPFDGNEKLTNFALNDAQFRVDSDMSLELLAMVERSNMIRIEKIVASTFTSETITFNGLTYTTVLSPDTSRIWLDRNLGATQVCTSSSDSDCYGNLYQWGRNDDGHESRDAFAGADQVNNISPGNIGFIRGMASPYDWTTADGDGSDRASKWADGGSNDICPAGFRVPTEVEITNDTASDTATVFSSFLKLPAAGWRYRSNGTIAGHASGTYWSNTTSENKSRSVSINVDSILWENSDRAQGRSVRCIKG